MNARDDAVFASARQQLSLFPIAGLQPIAMDEANQLLQAWAHRLGPVRRPFHQEAYALVVDGAPVAVATSGTVVSATVAGYRRTEVVELTRLCTRPDCRWASRVMLRLWRECCAPRWARWPVRAAVSYSIATLHAGDLYRFDGWERVGVTGGPRSAGRWTKARPAGCLLAEPKVLWVWRYD